MPGTRLKQIGTGATKDCKSAQKPLWNIPPVNRLIGIMFGYETGILEQLRRSQAKMGAKFTTRLHKRYYYVGSENFEKLLYTVCLWMTDLRWMLVLGRESDRMGHIYSLWTQVSLISWWSPPGWPPRRWRVHHITFWFYSIKVILVSLIYYVLAFTIIL